ncbi:hypothetical protein [Actinoplanes sp. NPDC026619]|uniref:hypothetical protein n=1 Tax=Actinoplanes sp. NPDC026619 TaxID=3155798 RepID=UPI0033F515EF
MAVDQGQQSAALMQIRFALSTAFGDLQVALLRELAAQLKVGNAPPGHSLPVEAMTDQLEAAVREAQSIMIRVQQTRAD